MAPILGIISSSRPPIWTPSSMTNLKAWYDASDTSTISLSGSAVTQWNDKSANGYNLTQGTAAARPTSGTTTLNGKNVIVFNGTNSLINSTKSNWRFLHDGTKVLLGWVVKYTTSSDPANFVNLIDDMGSGDTNNTGVTYALEDRVAAGLNNDSRVMVTMGAAGGYVVLNDSNNVLSPNTAQVETHLSDFTNSTYADRESTFVGTGTANKNNTSSRTVNTGDPTYNLYIGASANGSYTGISGYIAEMVMATGTDATETNRVKLRDYLTTKWGL